MNLILLSQDEIAAEVTLTDRRAEHIRKVLKSTVGDQVRIGVINGPLGRGTVLSLDYDRVVLATELFSPPPPVPPTDLILAVPRPIMLKRVLAQACSLGVRRIFLVNARRVEKSFFSSHLIANRALEEALLLGLEQAVDTRLPEVSIHPRFRPFCEDLLPGLLPGCANRFLAHPDGEQGLTGVPCGRLTGPVAIAIGPEGGWVDFEIDLFKKQGFTPFSLGPRILRVDTAVPALLAQISLLRQLTEHSQAPASF